MAGHVVIYHLESLKKYDVINLSRSRLNDKTIIVDVKNLKFVKNLIIKEKPDVIVNCIGVLIKESEEFPDRAIFINSYFPHYLEKLGKKLNFKLIHLSTDCVFSGKKGEYSELDFHDGADNYAKTKSLGEVTSRNNLTFRTSIIGPELKRNGTGLFNWFMNQARNIKGFINVYWTGITSLELAKAIDHAIEQDISSLYHLVPVNKISKYDLLCLIKEIWKKPIEIQKDSELKSDKSLINNRTDFNHSISSYRAMLIELYEWMRDPDHKNYYLHYF